MADPHSDATATAITTDTPPAMAAAVAAVTNFHHPHHLRNNSNDTNSADTNLEGQMDHSLLSSPLRRQKRKADDDGETAIKKQKRTSDPSISPANGSSPINKLPIKLLQQIFLHLPPVSLARCAVQSKKFAYALDVTGQPAKKQRDQEIRVLNGSEIWLQARQSFSNSNSLPRPLNDFSERDMFRLIFGLDCQFCGLKPGPSLLSDNSFAAGPGAHGVRVIWPFGIRSCADCFVKNTMTDIDVLKTPGGSLRLGMPHAFFSAGRHYVPEFLGRTPEATNTKLIKLYYKSRIDAIMQEYDEVKGFGEGTANEWRKGLSSKGSKAMSDAARWEKWEHDMRLRFDLPHALRLSDPDAFPRTCLAIHSKSAPVAPAAPVQPIKELYKPQSGPHPLPKPVFKFAPPATHIQHSHTHGLVAPNAEYALSQQQPSWPTPEPKSQISFQTQPPLKQDSTTTRPQKTQQEAAQAQKARKEEIERRCLDLAPAILPEVLQLMPSFNAAITIAQPLTEDAWRLLLPKLEAETEAAEIENEKLQAASYRQKFDHAAVTTIAKRVNHEDMVARGAAQSMAKQLAHSHSLLQRKLNGYANDYINGSWRKGDALSTSTVPVFAAETLLYVARRFNEDMLTGALSDLEWPQGDGSGIPYLSLDAMRIVHDRNVMPLAGKFSRELFICAGCVEEELPTKWMSFESLLQHYAAKHADGSLSKLNIVVDWNKTWPKEPPFATNLAPHIKHSFKPLSQGQSRYRRESQDGYKVSKTDTARPQSSAPSLSFSTAIKAPDTFATDLAMPQFAADALEIWNALEGVKGLDTSVRLQTVFHHAQSRFWGYFSRFPSLQELSRWLSTDELLGTLKDAKGLACKACATVDSPQFEGSRRDYISRIRRLPLFKFTGLIKHVMDQQKSDIHHHGPACYKWDTEMIEVPTIADRLVQSLVTAPGMDDSKLELIAAAFPGYFPTPLPVIGLVTEAANDFISKMFDRGSKSRKKGKSTNQNASAGRSMNGAKKGSQGPEEGEYDPRRPSIQTEGKAPVYDASRFDTDFARKSPAVKTEQNPLPAPRAFGLAPETIAALSRLPTHAPSRRRQSRSPSVGATDLVVKSEPDSAAPGAPDLAAILAALQAQQPGTAPASQFGQAPHTIPPLPQQPTYAHPHGQIPPQFAASQQASHGHGNTFMQPELNLARLLPIGSHPHHAMPQTYGQSVYSSSVQPSYMQPSVHCNPSYSQAPVYTVPAVSYPLYDEPEIRKIRGRLYAVDANGNVMYEVMEVRE